MFERKDKHKKMSCHNSRATDGVLVEEAIQSARAHTHFRLVLTEKKHRRFGTEQEQTNPISSL